MDSAGVVMFCHHLHYLEYNWGRGDDEASIRKYAIIKEEDEGE